MTLKTATTGKPGECREAVPRAAEEGRRSMLAQLAAAIVERVYSSQGSIKIEEASGLQRQIGEILSDSEAPQLKMVGQNRVYLRCRGDPFEMGNITDLHEALIECREYLSGVGCSALPSGGSRPLDLGGM